MKGIDIDEGDREERVRQVELKAQAIIKGTSAEALELEQIGIAIETD